MFVPYDLQQENYTPLLWLFEGATSYYDDLMLVRSGLINEENWLQLLSTTLNSVLAGNGHTKQSVAQSSFDAWVKYYRAMKIPRMRWSVITPRGLWWRWRSI